MKHLENDLNPIYFQPLFTCHKESLMMIFPHLESQFSDKEKNSHTHTLWRNTEILESDSQLAHGSSFFSLFSLHPLWERNIWPCCLICPPSCSYHTQDVVTSEPIHKALTPASPTEVGYLGGREVAGAINSSSHFLHHPTPFHSLQSLGPNEYRCHTISLHKAPPPQVSFVISRGFWGQGTDFTWDE